MATNDKHCQTSNTPCCQTFTVQIAKIEVISEGKKSDLDYAMYDETVEVNAPEIDSPPSEEEVVKAAMSKFNPPVRHTARHDFDSESETESDDGEFLDRGRFNASGADISGSRERKSQPKDKMQLLSEPESSLDLKPSTKGGERAKSAKKRQEIHESSNSETDSEEELSPERERERPEAPLSGQKRAPGVVIPAEGAYDPKNFQDLKVPSDIEQLFSYIMKYTPQKIDIDFKLQPFVPEFVPAVGDIDAFIKVSTPACNVRGQPLQGPVLEHIDNLGLTVLDEPAAEQSDSALLHLQLRAISKTHSAKSTVLTKKIENAEKNTKAIDRWIKDVSELHLSKPAPTVNYTSKMPDIDTLMEEWPETMEETLNEVGFPPPNLDCTLAQYVDLVCGLFDIPVAGDNLNDRIQALHLLFSLYSAVKSNQLFDQKSNATV